MASVTDLLLTILKLSHNQYFYLTLIVLCIAGYSLSDFFNESQCWLNLLLNKVRELIFLNQPTFG